MIKIRKSSPDDLKRLMELTREAQAWFRSRGIDQWQDGYPTPEIFLADIEAGNSYVGELEGEVILTGCLAFGEEPTYAQIYEGAWLNEAPYGVVHRLVTASAHKGAGRAEEFFRFAIEECRRRGVENLRVDTHRDNLPMQRLLQRLKFRPTGRIVLESGADRNAYQLPL